MSFRLKIVLVTTMLITILFSIGGTVLIHTTFRASLEKEETAAIESNEMILRIVQYVGEGGTWLSEEELISVIKNVGIQESTDYLRLTSNSEEIYVYERNDVIGNNLNQITQMEENHVLVTYFSVETGEQYLQTTIQFTMNGIAYHLDMGRNLTAIYDVREGQVDVFQRTFFVLFLIDVILSWVLATLLTRPLRKLKKASKEIESGNLSYRSGIQSADEIGEVSEAFDKMAEELENKIIQLKESAEQKEMFMGAFTHELKTPMTSIIGYADLLRTQKLSAKDKKDALDYIFSEAKRLENLSIKMLDLFVADKREITLKTCSPAKLTLHVARHLQNLYEESNIKIEVKAESGTCLLEPDLYQTLLINLLDNARKSMEQDGVIRVDVAMTPKGCSVSVEDNGKGIPKEAMKHLTEAFYRVDKARARSRGNAGLGLALCDKIVNLHGGRMEFESKEGIGTKVMVSLNGGRDEE